MSTKSPETVIEVASHDLFAVGAVRWQTGQTAGGIIEHYSKWHLWMQDGGKTLCGRHTPPYAPHTRPADAVTCVTCRKIHTANVNMEAPNA